MIKSVHLSIQMPSVDSHLPGHDGVLTGVDRHLVDRLLIDKLNPAYRSDLDVELDDHPEGGKFLNVQIHGLDDETSEIIRRKIEDVLVGRLRPKYRNLIKVKVTTFAGTPER